MSITTTNIYAEIDLSLKTNAVALCEVGQPRLSRSRKEDMDLMAFLEIPVSQELLLRSPPSTLLQVVGAAQR